MAIIYTYPPVTNPDGTELIVVSETKNKNSTRLITLAGICEFCDETSCDHSFRYIRTSSGIPAQAIGCDDELTLTSSDASVTITNAGNTIDLKCESSGPGGCPTTYVLKPVSCNTETGQAICTIEENSAEWIFTCETSFASMVPGYVSLENNGSPVTYPVGDGEVRTCWYADIWAPVPTAIADCDECCDTPPEDPVVRGRNCENGEILFEALQSNISGPAGWESAIDNDCEFGQFSGGTTINCIKLTLEGTDDGSTPILNSIKSLPVDDCGCECCVYDCSFTLTPCPGTPPVAHDPLVGTVVAPSDSGACVEINDGDVVNVTFEGESYCYTLVKVCLEPALPVDIIVASSCEDPMCNPESNLRWKNCSSENWLYESALDPIPAPFNTPGNHYIGDLDGADTNSNCIDGQCCIEVETTMLVEPETAWSVFIGGVSCDTAYSGSPVSCDCCTYYDVATYIRCDERCFVEGNPEINIDVCAWGNEIGESWKPSSAPDFIKIDLGDGTLCCYEKSEELPCAEETLTAAGRGYEDLSFDPSWTSCQDCEEATPDTYIKYDNCDDPTGDKWVSSSGTPGSEIWVVGQIIKQSGTCYEVLENPSVLAGPQVELGPGYIAYDTPDVDCNCCIAGPNRKYTRCSSEETIVVDPSAWANMNELGIDPLIRIEPTAAPGIFICYEFTECTNDAVTPGINDIEISTGCADPACQTFVQLQSCDGAYTETVALTDLGPSGGGLIASDVIEVTGGTLSGLAKCWTVININAPGPATQAGIQTWTGPVAGVAPLTSCECCEQELRIYTICEDAAGDTCNAAASSSLLIDVSLVPGWSPATHDFVHAKDLSSLIDCCYELNPEIPSCLPPTGVIINTVDDCADANCVFI